MFLSALVAFSGSTALLAPQMIETKSDLSFDDLFPRRSHFGKSARGMEWSHNDRYLLYLWNPVDDPGFDIYLFDTRDNSTERLTSIETMAKYDRETQKAIARHKSDLADAEKADKMTEQEYRDWTQKKKTEDRNRKEPLPSYSGVSDVIWAKKSDEFLFTFKGDVYRWIVGELAPERLTRTRESESQVEYTKDDDGFFFRRGEGVFRMGFAGPHVVQLNPELPNSLPLQGYRISPDNKTLMIQTSRTTAPERQVDWISYRERFAKAQKTNRSVADDKFNSEGYIYLYDLNDDPAVNPKHDGKPWEIWKWPGGEEWMETSVSDEPWAPKSEQFVFSTWKRTKKELEVIVADLNARKLKTIYKALHDGEHRTPSLSEPRFTPDGNGVLVMLENSGYRHAWLIDPINQAARQISRGDFETYPIDIHKDGQRILVRSGKDDPARFGLFWVDMDDGEYHRITTQTGHYGTPYPNNALSSFAVTRASWSSPQEMYLVEPEKDREQRLTKSHRDSWAKTMKLQPQLFRYQNRHGQNVHGYMFLPKGWKKSDKRPLMIYVYGGPLGMGKSVEDGTFNSSATMFNEFLTYEHGFVTVTIDPRGQTGYGSAFGKANWEKPGVAQVEDLVDGVKFLINNYGVDPEKVAINGWSFGGFQTQMCLYSAPDVFTLGIAGAGPTEWQNYNTWYSGGVIGPSRIGNPDDLDKYSLTKLAKNLRSPLLLLHGVEDTNVLFQDTIKVYQALLQAGKGPLVELAIDPTGGHGMGGDMNTRDRHAIYLAFILKHWGRYEAKK